MLGEKTSEPIEAAKPNIEQEMEDILKQIERQEETKKQKLKELRVQRKEEE